MKKNYAHTTFLQQRAFRLSFLVSWVSTLLNELEIDIQHQYRSLL